MSTGMAEIKDATDLYLADFDRIERRTARGPGAWLLPIRKAAISRFAELGFPTTQDEEWRYTSVAPIAETAFERASADGAEVTRKQLAPYLFAADVPTIVFVNGFFREDLSSLSDLPAGLRIESIAAAIARDDATARRHLARHAKIEDQAFTALNTALFEDGAMIHADRGTVVESPVHVVYVSSGGVGPSVSHPRTLVVAEESSQIPVVETFVGFGGAAYFTNTVTEVVVGDNATVDHYKITREATGSFHIGTIMLHQFRNGNGRTFAGTFDGGLIRHEIDTVLDGEGCDCGMNGLYLVDGPRHVDNHLIVEHAKPHCDSREFFKGILDGHGKGIFSGRIIVRPGAQKTDAKQTNMSLLLSQEAQVESKPQLEIFADDVKCTHGATIGQINEEALFYLRSRGIHEDAARSLLVYAFAADVLDRVRVDSLRAALERLVFQKLPHGDLMSPHETG